MSLTKNDAGRWILSGTNSYTGASTVAGGTLQLAKTASLYNATTASWTAANLRVSSGGTLAFNVGGSGEFTTANVTTLLTNLASSSSGTSGMNAGSALGFDTTNAGGGSFTIADVLADTTGASGGARGLVKLGTGSLVLTTANTLTGPTGVLAGGLLVNGSLANTAVTVRSGGRLGGTGSLGGLLALDPGAFLVFDPLSSGLQLTAANNVTIDSTFSVDSLVNADGTAIDWANVSQGTYTLLAGTTTNFSGITNFGSGAAKNLGGGKSAYFQNGSLQLVVVPEPAALALAAAAAGLGILGLRRRRA